MKRYRILSFDFDSRVYNLTIEIRDEWEERIIENHRHNRRKTQEAIIYEFGIWDYHQKRQNFIDLGPKPWSILAFHNKFQSQIREAFIIGAYYPALTAACALGERILNHLVIKLRDYFRSSDHYKQIYRKKSFDNWELAISALESWSVLLPEVAKLFREFNELRNRSIHFSPETDDNDRELALEAIKYLSDIIQKQFGSLGQQPWFIPNIAGEAYICKSAETEPFVKEIYLPNCAYVGPKHRVVEIRNGRFIINDDNDYEDREISDEEFRELRQPSK
jgi:hypothetical protein